MSHMTLLVEKVNEFGLIINLGKCVLGASQVEFFGYVEAEPNIFPLPEKSRIWYPFKRYVGMLHV